MDWAAFRRAVGKPHGPLGIRLGDIGMTALVLTAVELNVTVGNGPGAAPLDTLAYEHGLAGRPAARPS